MPPKKAAKPAQVPLDDPEPINLRELIVLLNHERRVADPRFAREKVADTPPPTSNTATEPTDVEMRDVEMVDVEMCDTPATGESAKSNHINVQSAVGSSYTTSPESVSNSPFPKKYTPTTDSSSPVKLTLAELDVIYNQSRDQGASFDCVLMLEFLVKGIAAITRDRQRFSLPLGPTAVWSLDPRDRGRHITILSGLRDYKGKGKGKAIPPQAHAVMVFPIQGARSSFVVDLCRMEFGKAGEGLWGESYFVSEIKTYNAANRELFEQVQFDGEKSGRITKKELKEIEPWMRRCAKRAWARYRNRDNAGWCEYCGVPNGNGVELKKCGGCPDKEVLYCCEEHREAGWKLHELYCDKQGL